MARQFADCRLCGGRTQTFEVTFRHGEQGEVCACDACHFHFVDRDSSDLLASDQLEAYRLESAGMSVPAIDEDFANGRAQSQEYIEEYQDLIRPGARVLEVGCSWGYFLDAARDAGAFPTGVEINSARAAHVRSALGLPCEESLERLAPSATFDAIFGFYVLEYFADPVATLRSLISRLNPGGTLVLITPNVDDVLLDVWSDPGYNRFFYDQCAVGYFSAEAVRRLASFACGGRPACVSTRQGYGIVNHLNWFMHHKPSPTGRVGSDRFAAGCRQQLERGGRLGADIADLIDEFDSRYRLLLESRGVGNQIILKVTNL